MTDSSMNRARRALLVRGFAAALSGACAGRMAWAAPDTAAAETVSIELFAPSGKSGGIVTLAKVIKSDADWRHQLSAETYQVTRRAGTEAAFSGRYASNHADGLYRCICCDTALYDSMTKYESGTGWPSFWQSISARNVVKTADRSLGMLRDAISCHRCDAHLGHVFDDGPKPTGLRYCMNSVALNFVARARDAGVGSVSRSVMSPKKSNRFISRALLAALLGAALSVHLYAEAADRGLVAAPPALDNPKTAGPSQTIVLSGGCFWGVQGVFEHVHGVQRVVAGYAGGARNTASYGTVSTGSSGHAESVQVSFNPAQISLGEILQVFFSVVHDPTQLNRQGPDVGTQYRSEIFYGDATQMKIADSYIAQLNEAHVFAQPIVTRVDSLPGFYPAEDYHQDFLIHNLTYPYIVYNDLPKIENLKRLFPNEYVGQPVLLSNVVAR